MHKDQCSVCKSLYLKEISKAYLAGTPVAEISRAYGIPRTNISRHVSAVRLDEKRDQSGLARVRRFLRYARIDEQHPPGQALIGKLIELEMKALGEFDKVKRFKGEIDVNVKLEEAVNEQVRNILLRLGFKSDLVDRMTSERGRKNPTLAV